MPGKSCWNVGIIEMTCCVALRLMRCTAQILALTDEAAGEMKDLSIKNDFGKRIMRYD